MFKFLNKNCEMIINIILVIVIIILIVQMFIKQYGEHLQNVDEAHIDKLKQAELTIYVTDACGYCQKLKKMLDDHDLTDFITFVDVNTPEGKKEYDKLGEKGVPVIKSKDGKIVVGYNDIEVLTQKLNI